jgi:hypothetical protein
MKPTHLKSELDYNITKKMELGKTLRVMNYELPPPAHSMTAHNAAQKKRLFCRTTAFPVPSCKIAFFS